MFRSLAKTVLPMRLLRRLRTRIALRRRCDAWRRARRRIELSGVKWERAPFTDLLIVPSDPWLIVGSRGDDAMVTTLIGEARQRNPNCGIGVVSVAGFLPEIVEATGAVAEPIWLGADYDAYLRVLERYDAVVVIGADVMDGHFSVADAFRSWSFVDLAARTGRRAAVVGFSFSHAPSGELTEILAELSSDAALFARERVSKENFDRVSAVPATLVADSAFLLPASPTAPDHAAAADWAVAQRERGRFVCAFNTHPMIFPYCDPGKVARFDALLADVFCELADRHPVSFLLVPHDFRDATRGDDAALGPLHRLLLPRLGERVFYAASPCRAAELKALAAIGDLLVTGRMHLGVGALSLGVPMWAINPQDKFIGLFEHFGLPDQRLTPEAALDRKQLTRFLNAALREWPNVGDAVRDALPEVLAMAAKNFSVLDTQSSSS